MIDSYYLNLLHSNVPLIDWFEYVWINKHWYNKIYGNVLEKYFTILWAIWTHINNVLLRNLKCNPIHVIELVNKIFRVMLLYDIGTNLMDASIKIGTNKINVGKVFKVKHCDFLLAGWLKWNTYVS